MALSCLISALAYFKNDQETLIRCRTLAVLFAVLMTILVMGQWAVLVLCSVVTIVAFGEVGNLQPNSALWVKRAGWVVACFFAASPWFMTEKFIYPLGAISLLSLVLVVKNLQSKPGISYLAIVVLLVHIACGSAAIVGLYTQSVGQLLALIFMLQVNDGVAYLVGRSFGRRLLAPIISPKKSLEGAIGGAVGTCLVMITMRSPLFPVFADASWLHGLGLVLIVVLFGVGGDLTFSLAKRKACLKDFDSYLPGHGGVLDRLDSLLATAPLVLAWNFWWIQ